MQRDRRNRDVLRPEVLEKLRGEVQAGGGRSDGSPGGGIDRLVGRAVPVFIRAPDVRRQGHVAHALEQDVEILIAAKLHPANAVAQGGDPARQPLTEMDPRPGSGGF